MSFLYLFINLKFFNNNLKYSKIFFFLSILSSLIFSYLKIFDEHFLNQIFLTLIIFSVVIFTITVGKFVWVSLREKLIYRNWIFSFKAEDDKKFDEVLNGNFDYYCIVFYNLFNILVLYTISLYIGWFLNLWKNNTEFNLYLLNFTTIILVIFSFYWCIFSLFSFFKVLSKTKKS